MAQLTVISREQHVDKRWKRYSSYSFAASDAVAPLVAQELSRACLTLPVGFVKNGDAYQLVAVQGLQQGRNLWVGADGRWRGGYVPAIYRGYPFVFARTEDDRRVLCFREDSGLLLDAASEGERFFGDDGRPAKLVQDLMNFLEQVSVNGQLTARICALLNEHGLIQPWNIQLKADNGEQKVEGLFRVDEAALNALSGEAFEALRQGGALPLVYCQLLSMQHLPKLARLASRPPAQPSGPANAELAGSGGDLDLEFLHDNGNIRFT